MESGSRSEDKARQLSGRNMSLARRRMPAWRALWKKLKKEKGRIFDCCDGDPTSFAYDPFAYALNFDPGPTLADPGDISRTFSARFAAVPSKIFLQALAQTQSLCNDIKMPKKKKIQKSLQDYLSKIKKPPTPQFPLPLPPLNSLPPKNWILSACKHPKTRSFTVDRDRDGADAATLADVDRFLFENFKSLYIKGDDDRDEGEVSRHGVGKQREEGDVVLFDSPRLIYPPLNLRGSKRFFITPGSSGRSLMEEARSSLTKSEDVGSSSTSSTTNTFATTVTTSAMDPVKKNESPQVEKVKLPDDCIAVVRKTQFPYKEFMLSMQEVVESRRLEGTVVDWEFMEEMLLCYLDLNDRKSHRYILNAFVDLVVALRRRESNNRMTSRSRGVRSNNNNSKKGTEGIVEFGLVNT